MITRIIVIAAMHFVACRLVVWTAMQLGLFAAGENGAGIVGQALVFFTRVLYFPILTLAIYPRQMFPGNWILLPVALNSLIWGLVLYSGYRCAKALWARAGPHRRE